MTTETRTPGTGSLRLHRNGTWYARLYIVEAGQRRQIEKPTGETDRRKAEKKLAAWVKHSARPDFIPPSAQKLRFMALVPLVCTDAARKGNRTAAQVIGTPERPGSILRDLIAEFGAAYVLNITAEVIDRWTDDRLAAGITVATQNRRLGVLRRMLSLAVKAGLIPSRPHVQLRSEAGNERTGFRRPGRPDGPARRTPQARPGRRGRNGVRLLHPAAAPERPLLGVVDVPVGRDPRARHRRRAVDPGHRDEEQAPAPVAAQRAAARRDRPALPAPHPGDPFLFHRDGRPLRRFDAPWQASAAAIGRPGLVFHDLRRSGARALRRAGVDVETIMRLGGWKTRSMFERYSIVDSTDLAEAQQAMTNAFATATPKVIPLRKVGS